MRHSVEHGMATTAARAEMARRVHVRNEMREQRLAQGNRAEVSESEAAYARPDDQWGSYLAKCGHRYGMGRSQSAEMLRRNQPKTADRIFATEGGDEGGAPSTSPNRTRANWRSTDVRHPAPS